MQSFFDERQLAHSPARELHNGDWSDFAEKPSRADSILDCISQTKPAQDHGMEAIARVHNSGYLDFLQNAHDRWVAAGRSGDAVGYVFPTIARRALNLERIDAQLGAHSFDAATPISHGTWQAAYWSAQTALTALDALTDSDQRASFALCRPPGHHAGRDYCGGYCYLNSAAIAAQRAHDLGLGPVAVLDVDYHHGNGTQDIFYGDASVFFASIHADPSTDYPFYWGHADEKGKGDGEGANLNLPLPQGTIWAEYSGVLEQALEAISRFGTKFLIVSYGADTFAEDPISHFKLTTDDMQRVGSRIASLNLPTLTVMEGGYAINALGRNVSAFLSGIDGV